MMEIAQLRLLMVRTINTGRRRCDGESNADGGTIGILSIGGYRHNAFVPIDPRLDHNRCRRWRRCCTLGGTRRSVHLFSGRRWAGACRHRLASKQSWR